jgi:hypothetical protein
MKAHFFLDAVVCVAQLLDDVDLEIEAARVRLRLSMLDYILKHKGDADGKRRVSAPAKDMC